MNVDANRLSLMNNSMTRLNEALSRDYSSDKKIDSSIMLDTLWYKNGKEKTRKREGTLSDE